MFCTRSTCVACGSTLGTSSAALLTVAVAISPFEHVPPSLGQSSLLPVYGPACASASTPKDLSVVCLTSTMNISIDSRVVKIG